MSHTDTAHSYLERGISVLPLRPGSKKPIGRWKRYQDQPLGADDARKWWGVFRPAPGLGIITGNVSRDLVVLDIEPEHVKRVLSAVTLPEGAAVAETARGGLHVYCRGERACGHLKLHGERIGDVRGTGGYVVAPPTVTDSGTYGWEAVLGEVDELPEVPEWAVGGHRLRRIRDPAALPPLRVHSRSIREALPTFVIAALERPRYTRHSPSELDFWVCCYAIRAGLDFAEVAALFEGSQLAANWAHSRGSVRNEDYLERTFGAAWVEVEEEFSRARTVKCVRVVVSRHNWRSQARASFTFWDPERRRVYDYTIPIILADGTPAPEWAWLAHALGLDVEDSPVRGEKRRCLAVIGSARGDVRWFLPREAP